MDPLQIGVVLSKEKDAVSHGYVLYGLVKPAKEGGIQSAAGMANVIPRKRIYRMEHVDELECFCDELKKRPLVLQPSVQAGSGIQKINCFFSVKKENWIMMINQRHPKIMGRIMMGIDAAKKLMMRGEPFILEYTFSDILKRLYFDLVGKPVTKFEKMVYLDCEHADLIVRYAGDQHHQGMAWGMKTGHIKFSFEDLVLSEVKLRTVSEAAAQRPSPIIQIVPECDLKKILPGWQFQEAEVSEEDEEEGAVGYESYENTGNSYVQYDSTTENVQPSTDKPGRIRGRSNRNKAATKYEVPVELHVQNQDVLVDKGDNSQTSCDEYGFSKINNGPNMQNKNLTPSSNDHRYEQYDYKHPNEHHYEGYRSAGNHGNYKNENQYEGVYSPGSRGYHFHQGSGRSGSSAADSGYDGDNNDNGGFENGKKGRFNRYHENIQRDLYVHREGNQKPYDNPAYKHDLSPKDSNKTMAAQLLGQQNYMQIKMPRQINYNHVESELENNYSDKNYDANSSQELQWTGLHSDAVSESFI